MTQAKKTKKRTRKQKPAHAPAPAPVVVEHAFADLDTVKISLESIEGYDAYVEIPAELSFGDSFDIDRLRPQGKAVEAVAVMIRSWNLRDREGKEVPFSVDAFRALAVPVAMEISDKVQGYFLELADEKKSRST